MPMTEFFRDYFSSNDDGRIVLFYNSRRIQLAFFAVCILFFLLKFNTNPGHAQTVDDSLHVQTPTNRCYQGNQRRAISFNHDTIINPRFTYIINIEDACGRDNIEIIMPVKSAVTNPNRRNRTRHFRQGRFTKNKFNNARLIFFVGLPSDKLKNREWYQRQLHDESDFYGDIVQINITDAYRKVVHKTLAILQWVSTYCSKSDFVIKMDDDVMIDPPMLLLSLYRFRNYYSEFIVGELRLNRIPERSQKIRWHMEVDQYPNTTYPPFVMGAVIGYPTSTALLLYQQALRTKTVWLDDVFITGICSRILGIPVLNDTHFNHVHRPMITRNFIYE